MKSTLYILLLFLFVNNSFCAQHVLVPNIKQVIVYSLGAEITHAVKVDLSSGQNVLIMKGISPHVTKGTVQINDDELTVINSKLVKKLNEVERQELFDSRDAYKTQISVLDSSIVRGGSYHNVENFKGMLEYYETKIISTKKKLREIERRIALDEENKESTTLEILVSSTKSIQKNIEIKYIVGSAAWVPSYEVYVPSVKENLKLKYIAKIMNKTGEDWKGVELNLSLNSPFDKTGEIPKLEPISTYSSRNDGNDFSKISESRLEGLKIEGIEYVEYDAPAYNQLISVGNGKDIPSNGGIYSHEVFTHEFQTDYHWYAFPSVEEHPYLIGRVSNWAELPLVDGDAKIYLNGTNIGDSYISLDGLPDTLDIPIGQSQELLIEREVIASMSTKKINGGRLTVTHAFEYKIKSNSDLPVKLSVFDQIPLSESNKVDIELINKSGAMHEAETGAITWNFNLNAKEEIKDKRLVYSIQFQKNKAGTSNFYSQNYSWLSGKRQSVKKVRAKF